ncbi:hypothetical protein LCGC14_2253120 [marine sediment metagenome]|uniref:Protein kinase domain-containing protein n=1 Tax=marine sediment metagenome TaxID=412755 RepID=A0A0F9FWW8_9ZZZZ
MTRINSVMKLFEIKPIPPEKFTPRPTMQGLSKLEKRPGEKAEKIGKGNYASAWSTATEPGTVRKVVSDRSNLSRDAYFQYIRKITKNERLSKNPYFPKIYDVQVVRDKNFDLPSHSYYVDMERLHALDTLSDEEVLTIGRKLIDGFDSWMNQTLNGQKMYSDPQQALVSYFIQLLVKKSSYSSKSGRLLDNIKDSNLKQALMFIKSVLRQEIGFFTDAHAANIMIRRGRHAPQLVFTDPLGG